MGRPEAKGLRQFNFEKGPNYTDSPLIIGDDELAQADNAYWDGRVKTIPGAARIMTTALGGGRVTGGAHYTKNSGTNYVVGCSPGRIQYKSGSAWTNLSTGMATGADVWYTSVIFNDTLILANGTDNIKKWDGSSFGDLGGTPSPGNYLSVHGDYILLSGIATNPGQVKYSDTSDQNTWPVGNVLLPGIDDGQETVGQVRYGDVSFLFKQRSVYILSGQSPADWKIEKSLSDVGCVAPRTLVHTDLGVFFWSEGGPAIFNGYRSFLLTRRLRDLMADVDWTKTKRFCAGYYPTLRQVVVSYVSTSSSTGYPDKLLIIDFMRLQDIRWDEKLPFAIWPCTVANATHGVTAMVSGEGYSTQQTDLFMGVNAGRICRWNVGTTFDGATITPRIRTKAYFDQDPTMDVKGRFLAVFVKPNAGNLVVRYSTNLDATFDTHASSTFSMAKSGHNLKVIQAQGDGSGNVPIGKALQYELTTSGATGFDIYGIVPGVEPIQRREV